MLEHLSSAMQLYRCNKQFMYFSDAGIPCNSFILFNDSIRWQCLLETMKNTIKNIKVL